MSAGRLMFVVVALAIILVGATGAIGYSAYESGDETVVENETFQPVGNTTVELEHSHKPNAVYGATVNVTNSTTDEEIEQAGNYTWQDGNGTLFVEEGSHLANQSEAHIDYSFSETTAEAFGMVQMFSRLVDAGGSLIYVVVVALVLAAVARFGGAG